MGLYNYRLGGSSQESGRAVLSLVSFLTPVRTPVSRFVHSQTLFNNVFSTKRLSSFRSLWPCIFGIPCLCFRCSLSHSLGWDIRALTLRLFLFQLYPLKDCLLRPRTLLRYHMEHNPNWSLSCSHVGWLTPQAPSAAIVDLFLFGCSHVRLLMWNTIY